MRRLWECSTCLTRPDLLDVSKLSGGAADEIVGTDFSLPLMS